MRLCFRLSTYILYTLVESTQSFTSSYLAGPEYTSSLNHIQVLGTHCLRPCTVFTMLLGSLGLLMATALPLALAQSQCSATQKCPASAPCCSEYGFCGTAGSTYCQQGCEPLRTLSLGSLGRVPAVQNAETTRRLQYPHVMSSEPAVQVAVHQLPRQSRPTTVERDAVQW